MHTGGNLKLLAFSNDATCLTTDPNPPTMLRQGSLGGESKILSVMSCQSGCFRKVWKILFEFRKLSLRYFFPSCTILNRSYDFLLCASVRSSAFCNPLFFEIVCLIFYRESQRSSKTSISVDVKLYNTFCFCLVNTKKKYVKYGFKVS